eukprot:TRINITY_DN2087_c0_g1_i1.p1 TRINITY_DN2087_c0_g1~~TRINITY_DN2087_c0_g1_i1.p1  ORF type:complete len:283 (+),score=130.31 TRINITY_DN2087_c0_g1_i1:3-851(+)
MSFTFVDLRSRLDLIPSLLPKFYDDLMIPNFPDPDELDPLDVWMRMLDPKDELFTTTFLHILLVFEKDDTKLEKVLAANVFEFYPISKCGFCSYLIVAEDQRGRGLGHCTTQPMIEILDKDAQEFAGLGQCPAIFAETNDPKKVMPEDDVMPPVIRLKMLQSIGYDLLTFDFVQPPLAAGQNPCSSLLFLILNRPFLQKLAALPEKPTVEEKKAIRTSSRVEFDIVEIRKLTSAFVEEYWDGCLDLCEEEGDQEPQDWRTQFAEFPIMIEQLKTAQILELSN